MHALAIDTCENEDLVKKNKALEWPQYFFHCKSMSIFQDTQVQLTPQSEIRSGRILNSETLWLPSVPARRLKKKAL